MSPTKVEVNKSKKKNKAKSKTTNKANPDEYTKIGPFVRKNVRKK
jgi:hypothetical protein